jgi:hypothetical protein
VVEAELKSLVEAGDVDRIRSMLQEKWEQKQYVAMAEIRALACVGADVPDDLLDSILSLATRTRRPIRWMFLKLVVEITPVFLKSPEKLAKVRNALEHGRDWVELNPINKVDQEYYWVARFGVKKLDRLAGGEQR